MAHTASCGTNTLAFVLVSATPAAAKPKAKTTATETERAAARARLDDDFAELKARCQRIGSVRSFVIFKTHRRATFVFDTVQDATAARAHLHMFALPSGTVVHVYPSAVRRWGTLNAGFAAPTIDVAAHAESLATQLRQFEAFAGTDDLPSIVVEDMDFDESGSVDPLTLGDPETAPHRRMLQTRRPPLRSEIAAV